MTRSKVETVQLLNRAFLVAYRYYGVPEREILSKVRSEPIASARHLVAWVLRKDMGLSEIGRHLGRDHASVYHGVKRIQGYIDSYQNFREQLEGLLVGS